MPERRLSRKHTEGLWETDNTIVLVTCHLSSAALGAGPIVCIMEMPRHRGGVTGPVTQPVNDRTGLASLSLFSSTKI